MLKDAMYRLEKEAIYAPNDGSSYAAADNGNEVDLESANSALLKEVTDKSPTAKIFAAVLNNQLAQIVDFYKTHEREFFDQVAAVIKDADEVERSDWKRMGEMGDDDDSDSDGETTGAGTLAKRTSKFANRVSNFFTDGAAANAKGNSSKPLKRRKRALSTVSAISAESDGDDDGAAPLIPDLAGPSTPPPGSKLDDDLEANNNKDDASRPSFDNWRGRSSFTNPIRRRMSGSFSRDSSGFEDSVWQATSDWATDTRITFKMRLQGIYRELAQLGEYSKLNYLGFKKGSKKFDKITSNDLQKTYMKEVVDKAYPFEQATKDSLKRNIDQVVQLYAKIVCRGDKAAAEKQLSLQLRENLVYDRATVWRELIGLHSRGLSGRNTVPAGKPIIQGLATGQPAEATKFRFFTKQTIGGAVGIALFFGCLYAPWFDRPEERNCLALLALASVFWAIEVNRQAILFGS